MEATVPASMPVVLLVQGPHCKKMDIAKVFGKTVEEVFIFEGDDNDE